MPDDDPPDAWMVPDTEIARSVFLALLEPHRVLVTLVSAEVLARPIRATPTRATMAMALIRLSAHNTAPMPSATPIPWPNPRFSPAGGAAGG